MSREQKFSAAAWSTESPVLGELLSNQTDTRVLNHLCLLISLQNPPMGQPWEPLPGKETLQERN